MSSLIYPALLGAVGLMIVAALLDAVVSVSRKPAWQSPAPTPPLFLVHTADRRTAQLPFVGADRRHSEPAELALAA